jgi:hypothetical protein
MKQFIYLNTDVVNSIIAQKEKSLMLELKKETEDSSGESKEKTANASLSGSIEGGISLLAKASGELTGAVGFGNQSHSQSIFKEIESRTLHDAAFDIAYKQLKFETNLNAVEFGDFIELDRAFDIVDFEYLDRLFLKDGFIDFLKNTARETVKKVTSEHIENTTGREQRRKRGSEIKQTIKEKIR